MYNKVHALQTNKTNRKEIAS